jgi:hypothetical protein
MSDRRGEWREANRANWDERVPIHVSGKFWNAEAAAMYPLRARKPG